MGSVVDIEGFSCFVGKVNANELYPFGKKMIWRVTEEMTGLGVAQDNFTKKAAIEKAREAISNRGKELFLELIESHCKKHGPSPLFGESRYPVKEVDAL